MASEKRKETLAYKGIKYDIYHWEQTMYDGSVKTFERAEHHPTVTVFATDGEKLIIQKQTQPHMDHEFVCLPGGGLDPGEEPLAGAKREFFEEHGRESREWEYFFLAGVQRDSYRWDNHIFIAHDARKTGNPRLDSGERIQEELMTLEEFIELSDTPEFRHRDLLSFIHELRMSPAKKQAFLERLRIAE